MNNFCSKCGNRLVEKARFCTLCGNKIELLVPAAHTDDRKVLTSEIIDKDLKTKRYKVGEFLIQAGIATAVIILSVFRPAAALLLIYSVINIVRMICHNAKMNSLKYYVLERNCVQKEKYMDAEDRTGWLLWFENRDKKMLIGVFVEEEFYNTTKLGEAFYLVVVDKKNSPGLCYRKSEWIMQG